MRCDAGLRRSEGGTTEAIHPLGLAVDAAQERRGLLDHAGDGGHVRGGEFVVPRDHDDAMTGFPAAPRRMRRVE